MNADEFLKRVQPGVRRSRLAPYVADIRKLRESGCTWDQVRMFLQENGVSVSIAALSEYMRRQEVKGDGHASGDGVTS